MFKRNYSHKIEHSKIKNKQFYDQMTQSSTPQDFRFISMRQISTKNSQIFTTKNQRQSSDDYSKAASKFQSYKSFTDLMEYEIKALIETQQNQTQIQKKHFKNFLERYQVMINKYFQKMYSVDFHPQFLTKIFGQGELTFGETDVQKTLGTTDLIPSEQKKIMIEKIKQHEQIQNFLAILLKDLPNQLNIEYFIMTFQLLRFKDSQGDEQFQMLAENFFYDYRIKYINLRYTKTDTLSEELKEAFESFITDFLELLFEILEINEQSEQNYGRENQNNELGRNSLKRFGLYSSKDDFVRSDDESSPQLFLPRKKNHVFDID